MALSMRCNAIKRPPLSQTAALILMLSSCALARAPRMIRLASSSVRLIDLSSPEGLSFRYSGGFPIRKAAVPRRFRIGSWDSMLMTGGSPWRSNLMKPETVGMSSTRLARLDEVMERRYVGGGYLPGMLTYIWRKGHLVHTGLCGQMDIERGKPLREDAIFRIYSMSKPITAVALMILVEEGLIGLDDVVHSHIPAWKDLGVYASGMPSLLADAPPSFITPPTLRPMKVIDLMTHTSGLTYGFMMRSAVDATYRKAKVADRQTAGGLSEMIDQLAQIPLDFSPGTAWNYSVSIDVLGYLVEKLSGISF